MSLRGVPVLNPNPLVQLRGYIPVEDTICLDAVAKARGVTTNQILREAVREWIGSHAHEVLEAS